MSGSAPLVLSCNVRTVDDLQVDYSLSLDAPKPELPPSRPLRIVSTRAFGAYPSNDADEVKALRLEARVADAPALSHLTVRGEGAGYMAILAVDDNLIVLRWCLPTCLSPFYLVYDAVEHSIAVIPSHPLYQTPCQPGVKVKRETAAALSVLIARTPGGDGRSYALVKMAETTIYNGYDYEPAEKQDVLHVWRSSSRSSRWVLIRAKFPPLFKGHDVAHSYATVLAFTCGGHAFWANLFRGVMYCRVDDMLSALTCHGGRELKLDFINLPVEHPDDPPCPVSYAMELRSCMYRTIGRSGESSIKFVTIDGFVQLLNFLDCTLKVWSLLPDEDMTRWTERFLCLGSLAKQDEFKKAGLPTDMVPMYPSLSAEEDDVVYFMLGEYKKCCRLHKGSKNRCNGYIPVAKNPRYHLRVDMRRGVLLASARLPDRTSPFVCIASTSVVPSSKIQRESKIQRGSTSRNCGAFVKDSERVKGGSERIKSEEDNLNPKKGDRFASGQ